MAANDVRRSGEHRGASTQASGEFVTYAHFNQFIESFQKMFDGHATRVEGELRDMNNRLSTGSQRFTRQEAEVSALKQRSADHSDTIEVLENDRIKREAVAEHNQPRRAIWDSVKGNVASAIVLGVMMTAFLMWRDYDKAQSATVTASTTTTTTMSAPVPPVVPVIPHPAPPAAPTPP